MWSAPTSTRAGRILMPDDPCGQKVAWLNALRGYVIREGGEWTGVRARNALADPKVNGDGARSLLAHLAAEGLLVKNGKAWHAAERPTYERRLLARARMVLDLVAAGGPERWDQVRDGAGTIAQAIVDQIGHSVTDEPALGQSFREERDQLKATLAEVLAVFDTAKSTETGEVLGHLVPVGVIHPDDFARWRAAFDQSEWPPARCTCHPAKKPAYACRIHGWAATRDQPGEPT